MSPKDPSLIAKFQVFSMKNHPFLIEKGYAGFIPAVKAENLFGKTYGKLTFVSSAGDHEKGSDIPNEYRYTSMLQNTFVNQRNVNDRTVAEVVGVVPKKTIYTEVF